MSVIVWLILKLSDGACMHWFVTSPPCSYEPFQFLSIRVSLRPKLAPLIRNVASAGVSALASVNAAIKSLFLRIRQCVASDWSEIRLVDITSLPAVAPSIACQEL